MLAERYNQEFSYNQNVVSSQNDEIEQHLYLVKKQQKKKAIIFKDRTVMVCSVCIVFVVAFLYITLESKIINEGYEINSLKEQIAAVEVQCERVSLELEELRSLERLESYAVATLNMTYPDASKVEYIDTEAVNVAEAFSAPLNVAQNETAMNSPAIVGMNMENEQNDNVRVAVLDGKTVHPILRTVDKLFGGYFSK